MVVVPTYQEAEGVPAVIAGALAALPGALVLVVDDASPDGTAQRARSAGAEVLVRRGPRGLGAAYRDGFAWALERGFDPICQMDADGSHDPADLPRLVAALGHADLVLGSRYVAGGATRNWGLVRRVLSRGGNLYARTTLRLPFRDLTGGFKAWRADALRRVEPATLRAEGYAFQVEATVRALRAGARVVELPITFTERRSGVSKLHGGIVWEAAWRIPGLDR